MRTFNIVFVYVIVVFEFFDDNFEFFVFVLYRFRNLVWDL